MSVSVFDDRACSLGEGPLWHPERQQLYWFDILGKRLLTRDASGPSDWAFDRHVSAAGWIDRDTLLIATDTDLIQFDVNTGAQAHVIALEADNPITRCNDGRADPQGGFWIGTMGTSAQTGAGSLYRYYKGEMRQLAQDLTIPNSTCFAPDGQTAFFADTQQRLVWKISLDADGWPDGDWAVFLDHRASGLNPDGAVVDAQGRFWCAEWGASRVACYDPSGVFVSAIDLPVPQPSCPAFGGADRSTLFVTTARQGDPVDAEDASALSGQTLCVPVPTRGQAEHRVVL
jgi:sugar lactone lactonase YvrE